MLFSLYTCNMARTIYETAASSQFVLKVIHAGLQDCAYGLCCLTKYGVPKLLQFLYCWAYCIVDIDYLNNQNSVSVGELAINTTLQFILVSIVTVVGIIMDSL